MIALPASNTRCNRRFSFLRFRAIGITSRRRPAIDDLLQSPASSFR